MEEIYLQMKGKFLDFWKSLGRMELSEDQILRVRELKNFWLMLPDKYSADVYDYLILFNMHQRMMKDDWNLEYQEYITAKDIFLKQMEEADPGHKEVKKLHKINHDLKNLKTELGSDDEHPLELQCLERLGIRI